MRFRTLLAFVDGGLEPAKETRILRHLSRCERCRNEVEKLKGMVEALTPGPREKELEGAHIPAGRYSSCYDPLDLYRYFRRQLPAERSKEIRSHLLTCDFCSHVIESYAEEQIELASQDGHEGSSEPHRIRELSPRTLAWGLGGAILAAVMTLLCVWQAYWRPSTDFYVLGQKKYHVRSGNVFTLQGGQSLYTGDKFQLVVKPAEDLHLYIFLYTSSGSAQLLFPAIDVKADNYLKKGATYTIPPRGFWPLDEHTGTETIFLVSNRNLIGGVAFIPIELEKVTASIMDEKVRTETAESYLKRRFKRVQSFSFEHR